MTRWMMIPAVAALVLGACTSAPGGAADGEPRTIEVRMTDDLRFVPDQFTVDAGETVRFEVHNDGQIVHDFFIGDEAAQAAHAEEMSGDMHHDEGDMHGDEASMHDDEGMHGDESSMHDDEGMHGGSGLSLDPGASDVLEYTFESPGELLIGCHVPGHYDAGMVATITVR